MKQMLFFETWYRKGIITFGQLISGTKLKTLQELQAEFGTDINIIDFTRLYKSIPKECSGGSRGGRPRRAPPPPPLATKLFSISCSFQENLIKSYPGAPLGVGALLGKSWIRHWSMV